MCARSFGEGGPSVAGQGRILDSVGRIDGATQNCRLLIFGRRYSLFASDAHLNECGKNVFENPAVAYKSECFRSRLPEKACST